ncbi:aggregation factor core protein MAFp3, partial [Donghicola sp. C2-DW-16]
SFILELSNPSENAAFSGGAEALRVTGVILDDDGTGANTELFVSDPEVIEGDAGTKLAVFEVRLSQPASSALTVSYATKDGSAVSGADYTAKSGSLTFAAGQDVAFVSVEVKGDLSFEATEYFDLVVTPPAGVSLGTSSLVGTAAILDDESILGPVISVEDGITVEGNDVIFKVSL